MLAFRVIAVCVVASIASLIFTGCGPPAPPDQRGTISLSAEEVLRVSFRTRNYEPIQLANGEELLLRGVTYSSYKNGEWELAGERSSQSTQLVSLNGPPSGDDVVVQEITLESQRLDHLPGVYPLYRGLDGEPGVKDAKWNPGLRTLVRVNDRPIHLVYCTTTTGIKAGKVLDLVDVMPQDNPPNSELTAFPPEMTRVKQLAKDVIDSMPASKRESTLERARALCGYLRNSREFAVSRSAPMREPNIDPLDDFLFEHRRGDSKDFATALTLMLRSQGIPARMVSGYKGGEWNSLGEFYQVRELNAYAWAEVQVADPDPNNAGKKWLILDPTPTMGR